MKIGLDFHGVINAKPELFSILSHLLVENGHEVHVITGAELSEELKEQLEQFNIKYTHLFSVSSYHKSAGTKVWYDEKNTPWMDEDTWNNTKAWYCMQNKIDLHIDDSDTYSKFFKTPYMRFFK